MAAIAETKSVSQPSGRAITVEVLDAQGRTAADATIVVSIDNRPAGEIHTGSGADRPFMLFIDDLNAAVDLTVTLSGSTQSMQLMGGMRVARFVFSHAPLGASKKAPSLKCPDGTTGFPCVTCTDGSVSWRMCA